jgi:hypothetical protein
MEVKKKILSSFNESRIPIMPKPDQNIQEGKIQIPFECQHGNYHQSTKTTHLGAY